MDLFYDEAKGILARMNNTRPVHGKIQRIFLDGKKEQLLRGVDWRGKRFERLKPSTLKRRKGKGPPLVPRGEDSRPITHYYVIVDPAGPGRVAVEADWHLPWMKYHNSGTKNMAARPAGGFRSQDVEKAAEALDEWIMKGRA